MGTHNFQVKLKRVFDPSEPSDGLRILVDRFWPRGVKKADLEYDIWAKDVTPSDEMRRLFHADPDANWQAFSDGYRKELESSEKLTELIDEIDKINANCITLLFAFHNKERNHAFILQEEIKKRMV